MSVISYIGFGANLGDPVQQILDARRCLLVSSEIHHLRSSAFYLSSPVGYADQPDFINCVCEIETRLSAQALLELLQNIETDMGRTRDSDNQNAPRLIDLDLLLYGDERIKTETLIVPHPRIKQRLFVLQPLVELAPDQLVGDLGYASKLLEKGHKEGLFEGQSLYRLS